MITGIVLLTVLKGPMIAVRALSVPLSPLD